MHERGWMPSPPGLSGGVLGILDKVTAWVVVVGLGLLAAVIFLQVVARYVLNAPTVWSEELAISTFVWVSMLAVPLGLRRGEHLTLDFVIKRFSGTVAKVTAVGIAALTVLMFSILVWLNVQLLPAADRQLLAGTAGGLGIQAKVSWVYAAVIVGGALSVVFSIERAVLFARGRIDTLVEDADQQVIEQDDPTLYDQGRYDVRFDWGVDGVRRLAAADVTVVIDALRFSTTVTRALESGDRYPLDDHARATSLNGAAVAAAAAELPGTVVLGCLRNRSAVAAVAARQRAERGERVSINVVAAGERVSAAPDAALRFAVEDALAAGAIIAALAEHGMDHASPEAAVTAEGFRPLTRALRHLYAASGSGQELIARGWAEDLAAASELDATDVVPVLTGGVFVRH